MTASGYRLGVDVGGTFTDLALIDPLGTRCDVGKVLTTPGDPADAIVAGTLELLERADVPLAAVSHLVHGTTRVANAIIERKGARTALLTTRGFRDVLEIGRETRYNIYDPFMHKVTPLVDRNLRLPVSERVSADGGVLHDVDPDDVRSAVAQLEAADVEAVAVSFLHSYANPGNERRVAELLRTMAPGLSVTLSSDVAPEIREYERTSTAVANAYVRPLMEEYLQAIDDRLRDHGFTGRLLIMLSSGGLTTVESAGQAPIRLVESGPAAGVIAARDCARGLGTDDIVAFDMGGTTAKMSLIKDGEIPRSSDIEVARMELFRKGSGLPLKVPVIEMIEIGAGGGSIAHIDRMGLLKVGPQSAGAAPGPACYGLGGVDPTVTDADAVLGYLSSDCPLGGHLTIDLPAAAVAIDRAIAEPLGLSTEDAAHGVHRVVNESMARAVRVYAAERGHDVRQCSLVAFGGAGPVHAYGVARLLGIRQIVCPARSGVASAVGFLLAPPRVDLARTYVSKVDVLDFGRVAELFRALEDEARGRLSEAGVAVADIRFRRIVEMRYAGQGFEISVTLPTDSDPASWTQELLVQGFDEEYHRLFARGLPAIATEAVTWRLTAEGPGQHLELMGPTERSSAAAARPMRRVFFDESNGFVDTAVVDRQDLEPGAVQHGPAIVYEPESTVVIGPSATAHVDATGNLVIDLAV